MLGACPRVGKARCEPAEGDLDIHQTQASCQGPSTQLEARQPRQLEGHLCGGGGPGTGRSVEDKHYHGWKKSQFILELDLFQSDQEAVEEEEVVPESPMCVMCQLPMMKRTNRLTRQDFWGCLRFPLCRETLSLTYYQMPTEKIQPLMTEAQPSVTKKRSQVPIAPSNASWSTVGTPLEEDHAAAGSARFNMNVTKEEMEVLLRKREEDAVKCEVPK